MLASLLWRSKIDVRILFFCLHLNHCRDECISSCDYCAMAEFGVICLAIPRFRSSTRPHLSVDEQKHACGILSVRRHPHRVETFNVTVLFRYSDRTKVDADVAVASDGPINVAERVNVITQATFPWRQVSELRSTAWFAQARQDFMLATKTEYSTSCMVEMLLTLRSSHIGATAGIFNPSRVHDQRTWEGHAVSRFHASTPPSNTLQTKFQ
jgi:hypothetical protein